MENNTAHTLDDRRYQSGDLWESLQSAPTTRPFQGKETQTGPEGSRELRCVGWEPKKRQLWRKRTPVTLSAHFNCTRVLEPFVSAGHCTRESEEIFWRQGTNHLTDRGTGPRAHTSLRLICAPSCHRGKPPRTSGWNSERCCLSWEDKSALN